jgi:hypothetical protein
MIPGSRVRIRRLMHAGSCGHCNEGLGKAGVYDPRHPKWHGPNDTLQEAEWTSAGLRGFALPKGAAACRDSSDKTQGGWQIIQ